MLESDTHRAGHGFDKRDIEIFMNLETTLLYKSLPEGSEFIVSIWKQVPPSK